MKIFALDTNIISYLIQKDQNVVERYSREVDEGNECIIPPVAYYEIRRGLLARNAVTKAREFDRLCRVFRVGTMNISVWDEAAKLYSINYKRGTMIDDSDLFIAAFCIVNGYTLVTHNTKHFERIEKLEYLDWK
jgi:tRNA(fMet)-specific endonuclease VapC